MLVQFMGILVAEMILMSLVKYYWSVSELFMDNGRSELIDEQSHVNSYA